MTISRGGHFIVRVKSTVGVQFAHMELPDGYEIDSHGWIAEVHTGPQPDAETAWREHLRKRGRIK
jgi:hypothetical protein